MLLCSLGSKRVQVFDHGKEGIGIASHQNEQRKPIFIFQNAK